jgi:two-component system, chemotaxis family, CheB/CheR fusion protein
MAARPLRVFIADDNRDMVMLLGILFRSEGMVVRSTTRGTEVRSAVAEFRPDAVLLDIAMPDRSGLEVALELMRDYGTRCPVLIAVTAHSSEVARRLTAKSGFRHHVAKPYDPDALLKLVASVEPHDWRSLSVRST